VRDGSGPLVSTMFLLPRIRPLAAMVAAARGEVLFLPLAALCLAVRIADLVGNP